MGVWRHQQEYTEYLLKAVNSCMRYPDKVPHRKVASYIAGFEGEWEWVNGSAVTH